EGTNLNFNHTINNGADISISGLLPYPDPLNTKLKNTNPRQLQVYPNPVTDIVRVQLPDANGTLTVINSGGQAIYTKDHRDSSELSINTASWPAGVYTIRWANKNGELYSTRLVHR
ncbi:MAG TPA: T9SS type A sorting domain-containing protein, partial [Flavipsychrobacter sp.]|nr:T9SS type A sorting domain-containing protein [Flavipsychrobacter sp.]